MATPITSLTGNDTFQTWFNTTNSIISRINGVTANDIAGSTGIGVTLSSAGIATISNTGVVSFNGSTGSINFNDYVSSFNAATGALTGVTSVAAGTGITITGTTRPTITNSGVLTVNGSAGTVTNVAKLDVAQTFSAVQQFSAGIRGVSGPIGNATTIPTVASASTITITAPITFVSGGVAVQNINPPSSILTTSGQIVIIPIDGFSIVPGGNVLTNGDTLSYIPIVAYWDAGTANWYMSYPTS
jgi:hypothetical protein